MLTNAQKADRKYRINASELGTIFGVNPYQTPFQLWAKTTGIMFDVDELVSKAAELGNLFEPALLTYYENKYGPIERQVEFKAPNDLPLAATLDGIRVDRTEVVEAKTSGLVWFTPEMREKWGDDFPEQYAYQVQAQMYCSGVYRARLIALVAGAGGIKEYEAELDVAAMEQIVEVACDWWDVHVIGGMQPQTSYADHDAIKRIKPNAGVGIELNADDERKIRRINRLTRIKSTAEKRIEELKGDIQLKMSLATEGVLPSGAMVTFRESHRSAYAVAAKSFRTLRVPNLCK